MGNNAIDIGDEITEDFRPVAMIPLICLATKTVGNRVTLVIGPSQPLFGFQPLLADSLVPYGLVPGPASYQPSTPTPPGSPTNAFGPGFPLTLSLAVIPSHLYFLGVNLFDQGNGHPYVPSDDSAGTVIVGPDPDMTTFPYPSAPESPGRKATWYQYRRPSYQFGVDPPPNPVDVSGLLGFSYSDSFVAPDGAAEQDSYSVVASGAITLDQNSMASFSASGFFGALFWIDYGEQV